MPVSVTTARDPFRGEATSPIACGTLRLRIPQARVLAALLPARPDDPASEWPLLTRAALGVRAGYTATSGTVTRALNGVRAGSSCGHFGPGLLALGLVVEVPVDVDGVTETNHRITAAGIRACQAYFTAHGRLPEVRSAAGCTNTRYS